MATGVKPRDDDIQITRSDLETIQDAMKNKKFRDMLVEYCEEVRDPANQALFQKEMTQLEKERGYDVTFINPKGGYVIKTSVAGDRKAFINICSNDIVDKPSYTVQEVNGKKGMNWQIPYSLIPPREDFDHNRQRCVIYDVVFHPDTLRMAEVNKQFRQLVNKSAFDGLKESYNINLDINNLRFPKSYYKGMAVPAVIRKEDPNFKPPEDEDTENISPDILEKLYPQKNYTPSPVESIKKPNMGSKTKSKAQKSNEFVNSTEEGYTVPKYVVKQQKNVDLQEFTYSRDCKQYTAIPNQIVVQINLPLLSSTKDCILDVKEKSLSLRSEKPAKYKLEISLPYPVNDECGNAKFDKSKHLLIVTLPVIKINYNNVNIKSLKGDSGVESEENMSSQSDDENSCHLVEELPSISNEIQPSIPPLLNKSEPKFLDPTLGYILPSYSHNVLDDIMAFTFHVKNTEPDSVQIKNSDNKVYIKFTSIGSGFVPVHYAAIIIFDEPVKFENISGEAWDNNVILQLQVIGEVPPKFLIGISKDDLQTEYFDVSQTKKSMKVIQEVLNDCNREVLPPIVEVSNLGNETNIVVSSNHNDLDEDDTDSPVFEEKEIVWTQSSSDTGAKSILRKPMSMMRSHSESSVGDFPSSMDYISSDCIPEESSFKKTVRFNDVIARQFYRYNSSIEGQKKKNQRKKSKKRSQERRKSESEAEDDITTLTQSSKPRLKSVLKQRRDSGLADTSDAETDCKHTPEESYDRDNRNDSNNNNSDIGKSMLSIVNNGNNSNFEPDIWESKTNQNEKVQLKSESIMCDNIKHNTDLYNPDSLNKGKYLEVAFKNDLIFDLDM